MFAKEREKYGADEMPLDEYAKNTAPIACVRGQTCKVGHC